MPAPACSRGEQTSPSAIVRAAEILIDCVTRQFGYRAATNSADSCRNRASSSSGSFTVVRFMVCQHTSAEDGDRPLCVRAHPRRRRGSGPASRRWRVGPSRQRRPGRQPAREPRALDPSSTVGHLGERCRRAGARGGADRHCAAQSVAVDVDVANDDGSNDDATVDCGEPSEVDPHRHASPSRLRERSGSAAVGVRGRWLVRGRGLSTRRPWPAAPPPRLPLPPTGTRQAPCSRTSGSRLATSGCWGSG